MSKSKPKSFDPYLDWLKIPAEKRPPTYYDLLGVEDFEEDLEKIEESFQELYSKVRRYQVGDHGSDAIRILTEMSRAYDCLTSPHHKKKYDRELRGSGDTAEQAPEPTQELALDSPPPAKKGKPAQVEIIEDDEPVAEEPLGLKPLADSPSQPSQPAPAGGDSLKPLDSKDADSLLPMSSPLDGLAPTPAPAPTPSSATASSSSYENVWYIQTPDGRRLGPATQQELDEVVAHRRVNPQSMVWRVGWPEAKPVSQMFPELKPAAGPGSSGPYHKLQVRPEVEQSRKAIFFVVLLLGIISAGLGVFYGFAFTLSYVLMAAVGVVGAIALAAGLMELGALMNSPLVSVYRSRIGDEPTRKLFARVGGMCVLVSLGMITWQAIGYMRGTVRGFTRGMPNVRGMTQMPNVNVGGNSGGPSRSGPRGSRGSSRGSGIAGAAGSLIPSAPDSGGSAASTGTPPRIASFGSYDLKEGGKLDIGGSGFSGTTKVLFVKPGNAKSPSSALEAKFEVVNDSGLSVTLPLQLRFGREWLCEIHSNGGVAVSIPPATPVVDRPNGHARPNSVVRIANGAGVSAVAASIVILEGNNSINVMHFCRAYVVGPFKVPRGCNSNVLIGGPAINSASGSNQKIVANGGVSVFQQAKPFTVR